jgi:hypothetical protein
MSEPVTEERFKRMASRAIENDRQYQLVLDYHEQLMRQREREILAELRKRSRYDILPQPYVLWDDLTDLLE